MVIRCRDLFLVWLLSDYSAFDEHALPQPFVLFFLADFAIVHLLRPNVFLLDCKYSVSNGKFYTALFFNDGLNAADTGTAAFFFGNFEID